MLFSLRTASTIVHRFSLRTRCCATSRRSPLSFRSTRHATTSCCTAAAGGTPTQASRLRSEFCFRFPGFLSQSFVGPSPDPRRLLGNSSSRYAFPSRRSLPISAAHGRLELLLGRRSAVDIKSSEEERRDDKGDTHDTTNYRSLQRI
jgi:hypothetical protein